MREKSDGIETVRTEEVVVVGGFREDEIKTREERQTGTRGTQEADMENTRGVRRGNKGFREQQLTEQQGSRRKTQWWVR